MHPGSALVDDDQFPVESVALSDSNFNLACETGIRYPTLVAMLNSRSMMWRTMVIFHDVYVHTCLYLVFFSIQQYILGSYQYILVSSEYVL